MVQDGDAVLQQRHGMEIGGRPRAVAMAVDELLQGVVEGPGRLRVIVAIAVGERLELVHQLPLAWRQVPAATAGRFPKPLLHLGRIGIEIPLGMIAKHGGQIGR